MRKRKIIMLAVLLSVAGIQIIQPNKNNSERDAGSSFVNEYDVPDSVNRILKAACFDCHSNRTRYPWYSHIQPFGWLLARHIKRGKSNLNFGEFNNYSDRRKISKLKEAANQVRDNEMPLSSYKWMHKDARLSKTEKEILIHWLQTKADSISNPE